MGNSDTSRFVALAVVSAGLFAASSFGQGFGQGVVGAGSGQPDLPELRGEWRQIGTAAVELELAGLATGPVERVWYSDSGSLLIRTGLGRIFETQDFETWQSLDPETPAPPVAPGFAASVPEPDAQLRNPAGLTGRVYGFGRFVYRSEDGGRHWQNLTGWRDTSIIGDELADLAISPFNEDEITVATGAGVFRSVNGGLSWHGLNRDLPNLPGARIRSSPLGDSGAQIELSGAMVLEWQPGERQAWRPSGDSEAALEAMRELELRVAFGLARGARVTALEIAGDYVYSGTSDGRISVSANGGQDWITYLVNGSGAINAFWVDPSDPRLAVAALGTQSHPNQPAPPRVLQTINGGLFWDDASTTLPDTNVVGVTAERSSNSVYLATDEGIFLGSLSLATLGAPASWTRITGLPEAAAEAPVTDVLLAPGSIQLLAAVEGHGLFSALAPHRLSDPRIVSSADLVARAAAPGALFTVAGASVSAAATGGYSAPVLAAGDTESQIQIPFEATGSRMAVIISGAGGGRVLGPLDLTETSPAILVDHEGTPQLLDADSGVLLDTMHPARSRMRVQILMTGLGRVRPDWPTGTPAPLDNPPEVIATVAAYLDREPVEVVSARLAPGYIGFYLVEIEIPTLVNYGPAELFIQAGGRASNPVRVYIEP